jgi:hypothetical protein
MIPMVLLLNENREAIIPPRIREEVASKPQRNAFNIQIDFKIINLFFAFIRLIMIHVPGFF